MKNSLSKSQIEILKNKGTEPAFSGDLLYNDEMGNTDVLDVIIFYFHLNTNTTLDQDGLVFQI
ncbi:MAG: hypothetical protein Ct9H90mP3_4390 [Flammeovirgaceae bacterium]|nr:MAG: hypothetical protein Ct9H90mP3_4390 [Flammeovirgaceae bacterium]